MRLNEELAIFTDNFVRLEESRDFEPWKDVFEKVKEYGND